MPSDDNVPDAADKFIAREVDKLLVRLSHMMPKAPKKALATAVVTECLSRFGAEFSRSVSEEATKNARLIDLVDEGTLIRTKGGYIRK